MSFTQPNIRGYRQLTEEDAKLINEVKDKAEEVGQLIAKLKDQPGIDGRWVSIGATQLQQGFMAVIRDITQPATF
jgi:hypothetical protein